jgi:hypothetical protein
MGTGCFVLVREVLERADGGEIAWFRNLLLCAYSNTKHPVPSVLSRTVPSVLSRTLVRE